MQEVWIYITVVICSVAAGVLYRMGGSDAYNTKWRDCGVPACMVIAMALMGHLHWSLILCFGAMFGSMTTYNKWAGYFFNRPDKHTVYLESWIVTGFFYGLSMLPYAIATGSYLPLFLATLTTTTAVALVSELSSNVLVEENGRGIAAILPLLFYML